MTTRKPKAAAAPQPLFQPPAPPDMIDVEALLMIGEDRICLDDDEDDNVYFMAELIDTL